MIASSDNSGGVVVRALACGTECSGNSNLDLGQIKLNISFSSPPASSFSPA